MSRTTDGSNAERGAGVGLVAERLRAERRWLHIMRSTAIVVGASWLLLLTWLVPVGPFAWDVSDYGAALAIGVILALLAGLSTALLYLVWRPTLHGVSPREFVDVLLGADLLVLRPSQFQRRLARACKRRQDSYLIVLEFPDGVGGYRRRNDEQKNGPSVAALTVRSIARAEDDVADISGNESWVLAHGDDGEEGAAILRRLAYVLLDCASATPDLASARLGLAPANNGFRHARDLIEAARAGAAPLGAFASRSRAA